jgi:hypothetical protein
MNSKNLAEIQERILPFLVLRRVSLPLKIWKRE